MAEFSEDIFFSPAVALNERLRKREFSVAELTRAFAERLERLAPRWNALALSLRGDATARCSGIDKELKRGRTRGPLQGVPYGVKDLLSVARRPTTWGAKPFAAQIFESDAAVVSKLARVGAQLIGKLSMVELAGGGGYRSAAASLQGPGLNPWDPTRWAGGSSSGSAAAVAAGLVTFALGSETSGSILTPCAFCGVTGLRPTYGLVSRAGAMALAWTMDKIGPIAHTAEDCGHILQVIAGADADDPGSARRSFHFAPEFARPLKELRIGFAASDFTEAPDEPLRAPLGAALEALKSCGAAFSEVSLPAFPYGAVASTIISAEGSSVFADLIASGAVDELADRRQIAGLKAGLRITATEYLQAMRVRRLMQQAIGELFSRVDVLVSPARFSVAPDVNAPLDRSSSGSAAALPAGLRALIPAGNLAGLPALVLPAGFAGGLPVALSLVGRPFSENTLVKLGMHFQGVTDAHRRRPPRPA